MITGDVTLSTTAYTAITTKTTFYIKNNNSRPVRISIGTALPAVGADYFHLKSGETLSHLEIVTGTVYALDDGQTPTISVSEPAT